MHEMTSILDRVLQASVAGTVGTVMLRLSLAAILGGAIGVERELKHRPSGLRTNMFICFGSALFTMLSALLAGSGQDQTRIAAQIIAGIGFLGAGSILHSRGGVQGLTSAATIFVVAGIGMCAGSGLMLPAIIATGLLIFGLLIMGVLEQRVFLRPHSAAYEATAPSADVLYSLLNWAQKEKGSRVQDVSVSCHKGEFHLKFTVEAKMETHQQMQSTLRSEFESRSIVSYSSSVQE